MSSKINGGEGSRSRGVLIVRVYLAVNWAVNAALATPALKDRFHDLGGEVMPMSPAEYGKMVADETAKWAKVVKSAGLKVE